MNDVYIYAIEHDQNGCSDTITTHIAAISPEDALRQCYPGPYIAILSCERLVRIDLRSADALKALKGA